MLFLISIFTGCIHQKESADPEYLRTYIQPELSTEEFIELVNTILVDKVKLEVFDVDNEHFTYIKNTYDCDKRKIHISVRRYPTKIYISVRDGHFRELSGFSEMIDTRGLFTEQIERQVDLTPPSNFKTTRTYCIEVMDYKGILEVSRGKVSVHFMNIGALSPTPTPPGPRSFISKVLPYVVTAIFVLAAVLVMYGIIVLKRRKKL
jgi:hypothetical protein